MTLPTFTPPKAPTLGGARRSVTPATRIVAFGDGYEQRAPDGLNPLKRKVSPEWTGLTVAQADEIDAFFAARGGHEAFLWTEPGFATERKWRVVSWTRDPQTKFRDHVSAEFVEVFDP